MANQREDFESAIMRSLYGQMGTPEELFRRDADGDCYTNSVIQSAWWGYQVGGPGRLAVEGELDRNLILRSMATLALQHPGFDSELRALADRFGARGNERFEQLKEFGRAQMTGFIHPPAGRERILPVSSDKQGGEL